MVKYSVSELKLLLYLSKAIYYFAELKAIQSPFGSPKAAVHGHIWLFFDSDYLVCGMDEIVDLIRGGRCRSVGQSA